MDVAPRSESESKSVMSGLNFGKSALDRRDVAEQIVMRAPTGVVLKGMNYVCGIKIEVVLAVAIYWLPVHLIQYRLISI